VSRAQSLPPSVVPMRFTAVTAAAGGPSAALPTTKPSVAFGQDMEKTRGGSVASREGSPKELSQPGTAASGGVVSQLEPPVPCRDNGETRRTRARTLLPKVHEVSWPGVGQGSNRLEPFLTGEGVGA
jgi:hypothetical protein